MNVGSNVEGQRNTATRIVLVQHAEKEPTPGDPGLSAAGHRQALALAAQFERHAISLVLSSPSRRARETAQPIADAHGLALRIDDRLRERMNWGDVPGQTFKEFWDDRERATRDRDFVPRGGESSHMAGQRLLRLLDEMHTRYPGRAVLAVTHGGVTWDLLRTVFGDDVVSGKAALAVSGMPGGAVTDLTRTTEGWSLAPGTQAGTVRSAHLP